MASITEPKLFLCLHCGAGVFAKKQHKRYKEVMKNACKAAHIEFKKTKCVRASVIAATEYLENSELINAGFNSSLTLHKTVECDAGIISVNDQKWAAMTAISNIKNPIKAVETLYLKSKEPLSNGRISPIFLCGTAAEHWCKHNNVPYHNTFELTPKQQHIFTQYSKAINNNSNDDDITMKSNNKKRKLSDLNDMNDTDPQPTKKRKLNGNNGIDLSDNNHGTCGVIGYDTETQRMYVTTSSGGIWMKHPGRIGPSAVVGSGFDGKQYIRNDGKVLIGCCTSGSGEYLMQYRLAEKCCKDLMDYEVYDDEDDIMDENVLTNVFDGFRRSVSDSECIRTAGCLVMKVVDNIKDEVDISIHWVHNSDGMGVAVMCDGDIKTYMSMNDERDKIVISGHQCSVYGDKRMDKENIRDDVVFMNGLEILNKDYTEGDEIEYNSDYDSIDGTNSHIHKGHIVKISEESEGYARNYVIVIKDKHGTYTRYRLNEIGIKWRENIHNNDGDKEQDIAMQDKSDDNMDATSVANVNILHRYASDLPSYMITSPINDPD